MRFGLPSSCLSSTGFQLGSVFSDNRLKCDEQIAGENAGASWFEMRRRQGIGLGV